MRAAIAFDTLEYMGELTRAGMTKEQAEAITKATSKAFVQLMQTQELATKSDIERLKEELKGFIIKSITSSVAVLCGLQIIIKLFV